MSTLKIPGIIMFLAIVVLQVFVSKRFLANSSASLTATCNSSTFYGVEAVECLN